MLMGLPHDSSDAITTLSPSLACLRPVRMLETEREELDFEYKKSLSDTNKHEMEYAMTDATLMVMSSQT
jgi:hypothetical protein